MKNSQHILLLLFTNIVSFSLSTSVCRDVKVENISLELTDGSLTMVLQDGRGFDSFCGDEVGVVMEGLEDPIAKYSRRSGDIRLDVDICEEHKFQVIVVEYSFPTKVTRSPWTNYQPKKWFAFDHLAIPSNQVLWDKGLVLVNWWENVITSLDYLKCLIYVDFFSDDGVLIHSVLNIQELEPVELELDLCTVEWVEVKYTMVGMEGTRMRHIKMMHISAGLVAPKIVDLKLRNGTLLVESDVNLRCYSGDILLHRNGTILYSRKNLDLEKSLEVSISNFTYVEYCGNLTIESRLQNKANGSRNYYFTQVMQLRCPLVLREKMNRKDALDILGVITGVTLSIVTGLMCVIVIRLRSRIKLFFPQ